MSLESALQTAAGLAAGAYETLVAAGSQGASAGFAAIYTVSPIYLLNGVAASMPGGILAFADTSLLPTGFATFRPLAGSSLLKAECAQYPMANQAVAGNAIIQLPTNLSMQMVCPAMANGVPYENKSSVIAALVATLIQHNAMGGLYDVYTPAFPYSNGILLDFRDVTDANIKQAQAMFELDFFFPLITLAAAQAAEGSLYQAITSGVPIVGQPSFSTGTPTSSAVPNLAPPTIQ